MVKVWLGGWNFFLQFESSVAAHIETDTSLVLPCVSSLYVVLPDCDYVWVKHSELLPSMNVSNSGQRLRGPPPNGTPMIPGARPTLDQRNGSGVSGVNGGSTANERNPSGTQMSRAEKFEDEKRRIIESCFGKKEPDGSSEFMINM